MMADNQIEFCAYCSGALDTGWECDSCGADWKNMAKLHETFKKLERDQVPLGPEFERALYDNLSELYVSDGDAKQSL